MTRTQRQLAGDAAERLVAERLTSRGWTVLARNVHAGRSELDIVAADPGPPARLVVVEVRWRSSRGYGRPEETFDYRKRAQLRIGLARLLETGCLPDDAPLGVEQHRRMPAFVRFGSQLPKQCQTGIR